MAAVGVGGWLSGVIYERELEALMMSVGLYREIRWRD
jgi:hypothetical protein